MLPKAVLQTAASPPAVPALLPAADAAALERGAGALETLETTAYLFVNSTLAKPGKEEFDYSKNLDGKTSLGRPWGPLATVVRSELTLHHNLRSLGLAAVFHLLPATACVPYLLQAVNLYHAMHTYLVPHHPQRRHMAYCASSIPSIQCKVYKDCWMVGRNFCLSVPPACTRGGIDVVLRPINVFLEISSNSLSIAAPASFCYVCKRARAQ